MALPIGKTPVLRGDEAAKFLAMIHMDSHKRVKPTPTPNLHKVHKLVKQDAQQRQKHIR